MYVLVVYVENNVILHEEFLSVCNDDVTKCIMRAPAVFDLFLDESIRGMGAQPEASENTPLPFYVRSRLSDLAASTRRSAPAIFAMHWDESQGPASAARHLAE